MWFRNGFLIKYFPLNDLEVENPYPKLTEIQSFKPIEKKQENLEDDLSSEYSSDEEAKILSKQFEDAKLFSNGDNIKIIKGELINILGTIESIDKNIIKFKPNLPKFNEVLDIEADCVIKNFTPGDSVRVISGLHKGEKGLVTKVSGCKVIIFSHILMKEFIVDANLLKKSSEIAEAVNMEEFNESKNEFWVYSIVKSINNRKIYIVLDIEKDTLKVMDEDGDIKYEYMREFQLVRDIKYNLGVDRDGNKIKFGDAVKIVEGPNKGSKGIIIYVFKNSLFLKNKEFAKTLGVFPDRCTNILILGNTLIKNSNEFMIKSGRFSDKNTKMSNLMCNKAVTIWKGDFKGQHGRVVSESWDWVNVEVQSQWKVIRISKEDVKQDGVDEETIQRDQNKTPVKNFKQKQNFMQNDFRKKNFRNKNSRINQQENDNELDNKSNEERSNINNGSPKWDNSPEEQVLVTNKSEGSEW